MHYIKLYIRNVKHLQLQTLESKKKLHMSQQNDSFAKNVTQRIPMNVLTFKVQG